MDDSNKKEDCPSEIFKSAKSAWQKQVALEFVKIHNKIDAVEMDIKWLKWLIMGIFSTTVVSLVILIIKTCLGI